MGCDQKRRRGQSINEGVVLQLMKAWSINLMKAWSVNEMGGQSGGSSGLGQPLLWSERERRVWILLLFLGSVLCYAGRNTLSVSIVEMATEFNWNKKICVS